MPLALVLLAGCAPDERAAPADAEPLDIGLADAASDFGRDALVDADGAADFDAGPDAAPDAAPDATPDAAPDADPAPDAAPEPDLGPRELLHIALGAHAPGDDIRFELPAGLDAVLMQARGAPDGLYHFAAIEDPAGSVIGEGASRVTFNPEAAVALIPNNDRQRPPAPGAWRVVLGAAGPDARPLEVEVYGVRGRGHTLRIHLLIPPATGRGVDDASVNAMALALEAQLGAAFDLTVIIETHALADEAPAELAIDGEAFDYTALGTFARTAPLDRLPGLDLYLVDRITDGANTLTAFAGGLPAPFLLPGTAPTVAAVPIGLIDDFPAAIADRAVHELGHALGLFHTTEPFGDRSDPISDTPQCPLACDADGDGILFARECGAQGRGEAPCRGAADNLMFWTLGGLRTVTAGQRRIAGRHPVIEQ